MKLKIIKYTPITAKPLNYLKIAVDKDGDGIPQFLDCNDRSAKESGVLHDWLQKQRLLQERKHMAKLDIEPTEAEQDYYTEELSKSETSIEDFKTKVEDRTSNWKKNIKAGFKGTDRNFSRIAKAYDKPTYQHKITQKQHPQESSIHLGHMRAVSYLINAPTKLFGDSFPHQIYPIDKTFQDMRRFIHQRSV